MRMKILLTGGTGLVGTNILERKPLNTFVLTPNNNELNLFDSSAVEKYLKAEKPDLIIHAAGIVGGIQANIENPVRFLTDNTLMAHNLILNARDNNVKYFLNLGSSCMYPREAINPLKEEYILTGQLEPTNEGYALSKLYAQRLCSYINTESKNTNYKTLVPCNLYGRWDKFDSKWGHMIPAVIRKIHEAKTNNNQTVNIWGDGSARREFMYAADLSDFIWFAVERIEQIPELMNVGLGYDFTINEYYKTISEVVGYKGNFEFDLSKPQGMNQKLLDISKLNNLGWSPSYSLTEGIRETYNFLLQNYSKYE